MPHSDKIKGKAADIDLQAAAAKVSDAAAKAKDKAIDAAHQHRDQAHGVVEKVAAAIDTRTKGKYADQIAKAERAAHGQVDKLADQHPDAGGQDS